MKKYILIIFSLIILGCNNQSNEDGTPPSQEQPPTEFVNDESVAPTVLVTFPISSAKTDAAQMTVKGTATSNDGFSSINISGTEAIIIPTSSDTEVNWSAKIEVAPSFKQKVTVQTKSNSGHTNTNASEFSINSLELPEIFTIDQSNNRLLGKSLDKIMIVNLSDNTANSFKIDHSNADINSSHISYNNRLDSVVLASGYDALKAVNVSLSSKVAIPLFIYDVKQDNPNVTVSLLQDSIYVEQDNASYFLVLLRAASDKLAIYKYSHDSNEVSLFMPPDMLNTYYLNGASVQQGRLAYYDNNLYFSGLNDMVFKLTNDGGNLSYVTRTYGSPLKSLNINLSNGSAYVVDNSGVIEINLASGERKHISYEANEELLKINYFRHSQVDEVNNELMILDLTSDTLIEIDLSTGERRETFKNGVGEGRKLTTPTDIAYSQKNKRLYVAEYDTGVIFGINLSTGDRKVLLKLVSFGSIRDILVDDESQQLYILYNSHVAIFNLTTKSLIELKLQNAYGEGVGFSTGFDLDKVNNKLLITDSKNSSLVALDLSTNELKTLTSGFGDDEQGTVSAVDVKINSTKNTAYVLSQALGAVFSVDLSNNKKSIVLDSCITSYGEEILSPNDWGLQQLFLDSSNQQLYIVASASVAIFNLDDNTCTAPRASYISSFFDIASTSKGQLVGTYFNKVKQLDLENGEHVIISK